MLFKSQSFASRLPGSSLLPAGPLNEPMRSPPTGTTTTIPPKVPRLTTIGSGLQVRVLRCLDHESLVLAASTCRKFSRLVRDNRLEEQAVDRERTVAEWERLERGMKNEGFRDGLDQGYEDSLQDGFDRGYFDAAIATFGPSVLRGMVTGISLFRDMHPNILEGPALETLNSLLITIAKDSKSAVHPTLPKRRGVSLAYDDRSPASHPQRSLSPSSNPSPTAKSNHKRHVSNSNSKLRREPKAEASPGGDRARRPLEWKVVEEVMRGLRGKRGKRGKERGFGAVGRARRVFKEVVSVAKAREERARVRSTKTVLQAKLRNRQAGGILISSNSVKFEGQGEMTEDRKRGDGVDDDDGMDDGDFM